MAIWALIWAAAFSYFLAPSTHTCNRFTVLALIAAASTVTGEATVAPAVGVQMVTEGALPVAEQAAAALAGSPSRKRAVVRRARGNFFTGPIRCLRGTFRRNG